MAPLCLSECWAMDLQQTAALLKCCSQQTTETHCSETGGEVIGLIEEEEHFLTGTRGEVMCKCTQITLLFLSFAETSGNNMQGRGNFCFMHQDLSMRKREL